MRIVELEIFHRLLCASTASPALRYGKLVALDVGTKRVGVAMCDETRRMIHPVDTWQRSVDKTLRYQDKSLTGKLQRLVESEGVSGVIVGFPLGLQEEITPLCTDIVTLIQSLDCVYPKGGLMANAIISSVVEDVMVKEREGEKEGVVVSPPMVATFWDERNSSVQARRLARTMSDRKAVAKKYKDSFAACLIMEGFLEHVQHQPVGR